MYLLYFKNVNIVVEEYFRNMNIVVEEYFRNMNIVVEEYFKNMNIVRISGNSKHFMNNMCFEITYTKLHRIIM